MTGTKDMVVGGEGETGNVGEAFGVKARSAETNMSLIGHFQQCGLFPKG